MKFHKTKLEDLLLIFDYGKFSILLASCWKNLSRQPYKIKILCVHYTNWYIELIIFNFTIVFKFGYGKLIGDDNKQEQGWLNNE